MYGTDRDRASASPIRPPAYAGRVGMALSNDTYDLPTPSIEAELKQLASGGITWVREDLPWARIEPSQGQFDWARLDRFFLAAGRQRMNVLGILDYSAVWASSNPEADGSVFYPPRRSSDFATYAKAVVMRYGSTGSLWKRSGIAFRPLQALEVWNEPYGSWFWRSGPSVTQYVSLVRATSPAIRSVDSTIKILASGDLLSWDDNSEPHERSWIGQMLSVAPVIRSLVDALAVHPYPEPRDADAESAGLHGFGRVALIREAEMAARVKLPLWITEIGWPTAGAVAVTPDRQATNLLAVFRRSFGEWGGYVQRVFVFAWYRSNDDPNDPEHNYGLLDPQGHPRPAWDAIVKVLGGRPGGDCAWCSASS